MLSEHPVAKEFHPVHNGGLSPDDVPYSWKEKVWWQCPKNPNHEWEATPNNRTKKNKPTGCPDCNGNHLRGRVPFERSLQGRFPEIAGELIPERSGFTAAEVLYGSKDVAWWKCPVGHPDYDMPINSRTNPGQRQGCSYCAKKRLAPEDSLACVAPAVAQEFLSTVNGTTPEEVFSQDNRRYVWQCLKVPEHRWAASPNNRVGKNSGCPYCSGALVWELNRLADLRPDLAAEWDSELNGALTPSEVSVGSGREVNWKCPKAPDHRWKARIYKRAAGQGCRFCAGHEASESTSLLALRPDLAAQLDAEKSGVSAAELTLGSNKSLHWICPVNPREHTWQAKVLNRTLNGTGCPDCNIPGTSAQEIQLAAELGVVLDIDLDRHTVPSAARVEKVDIIVPALSLIIEFDGSYWHDGTEEADAEKSGRLRTTAWRVVRVREEPLECLHQDDVVVPFQAPPEQAATIVLEHLVTLEVIPASTAEEYQRQPGPRAADRADKHLAALRTRANQKRAVRVPRRAAEQGSGSPEELGTPLNLKLTVGRGIDAVQRPGRQLCRRRLNTGDGDICRC